ncbi:hypothetical protein [Peribacillus asahii]|uniref:hypothetical protein n=1 Tax=Peribacillus asahii TaxID=228899 RepID=UPI002079686F|nr:hypothetical protein [Peribacillus asahii]USK61318.1 hypothetical protein LIT37_08385 [Peribacillus asahii]
MIIISDLLRLFVDAPINRNSKVKLQEMVKKTAAFIYDWVLNFSFPVAVIIPYCFYFLKNEYVQMASDFTTLAALSLTLLVISLKE